MSSVYQRRLRHVERIVVRNVDVPYLTTPTDIFFTLSPEGEKEPFYISPVAHQTLNPNWDVLRPKDMPKSQLLKSRFVMRVWRTGAACERDARIGKNKYLDMIVHETIDNITATASPSSALNQSSVNNPKTNSSPTTSGVSSPADGVPDLSLAATSLSFATQSSSSSSSSAAAAASQNPTSPVSSLPSVASLSTSTAIAIKSPSGASKIPVSFDELRFNEIRTVPESERPVVHQLLVSVLPILRARKDKSKKDKLKSLDDKDTGGDSKAANTNTPPTSTTPTQAISVASQRWSETVRGGVGVMSEQDEVLLEIKVELPTLEKIHSTKAGTLPSLPPNSVLFFMSDGIFAFKSVLLALIASSNTPGAPIGQHFDARSLVDDHDDQKLLAKKADVNEILLQAGKLATIRQSTNLVRSDTAVVCSVIQARVEASAMTLHRNQRVELEATRLAELKELVKQQSDSLERERIRVAGLRRAAIPRAKLIAQQCQQLSMHTHSTLLKLKERLQILKTKLQVSLDKVEARRRKLISQLLKIYPIAPYDPTTAMPGVSGDLTSAASAIRAVAAAAVTAGVNPLVSMNNQSNNAPTYAICGLPLPQNLLSLEDELISTALGYAGHLVILLSKYLQVPLRYRIIYKGSRSDICDDVVHTLSQFPLYFRNADERRFQCGCILLHKNIEHLLNARVPNWVQLITAPRAPPNPGNVFYFLEDLDILLAHEVPR